MRDITNVITEAASQNVLWGINVFYSVLECLKGWGDGVSFWEGEENWASISIQGNVVAYIWKRFPVVFVTKKHAWDIKSALADYKFIVFIESEKLTDKEFKMSYDTLKDVLSEGMNYDCFSAEDLWFSTNSI